MSDFPPELANEDERPLRSERRRKILRIVALVSMGLLVVPGAIGTIVQTQFNARSACELARAVAAPGAQSSTVRFELFPLNSAGWHCFADFYDGSSVRIATFGPIPGLPTMHPVSGT